MELCPNSPRKTQYKKHSWEKNSLGKPKPKKKTSSYTTILYIENFLVVKYFVSWFSPGFVFVAMTTRQYKLTPFIRWRKHFVSLFFVVEGDWRKFFCDNTFQIYGTYENITLTQTTPSTWTIVKNTDSWASNLLHPASLPISWSDCNICFVYR